MLEIEPDNALGGTEQARLLDLDGKTSEAIVRLDALTAQHTECGKAWLLRAHLALKEGEANEARSYYDSAVRCNGELRDDDLLERIVKSGGMNSERGDKRMAVTSSGQFVEREWDDNEIDDDDVASMDRVTANELDLE